MSNSVGLGTVKQVGRTDMVITEEDRKDIWDRYLELHPQFKGAKVLSGSQMLSKLCFYCFQSTSLCAQKER